MRSQISGITGSRLKGTIVESFTILTTTPNGLLQDRMLVILHCNDYETWLAIEKPRLKELLLPFEAELMTVYEVSSLVNSQQNDTPACVEWVVSTNSLFAGVYKGPAARMGSSSPRVRER